jgi:hypothetical protein
MSNRFQDLRLVFVSGCLFPSVSVNPLVWAIRQLPRTTAGAVVATVLFLPGCSSRPAAVKPPSYDPQAFADSLLARCDSDNSGSLTKEEAERAPGLVSRWSRYDTDKDGTITRAELESHVEAWVERGDGLASINCVVLMGKRQIGDVTVKLIPDESLAGVVHPAETVSHVEYASSLSIPAELKAASHKNIAGMQYGLYDVEVSHPSLKLVVAADSRGFDVGPNDQAAPIKINVQRQ